MLGMRSNKTDVLAILTVSYGLNETDHPGQTRKNNPEIEIAGHPNRKFFRVSSQGVL